MNNSFMGLQFLKIMECVEYFALIEGNSGSGLVQSGMVGEVLLVNGGPKHGGEQTKIGTIGLKRLKTDLLNGQLIYGKDVVSALNKTLLEWIKTRLLRSLIVLLKNCLRMGLVWYLLLNPWNEGLKQ